MAQASGSVQRGSGGNTTRWLIFGLIAFVFALFGTILWFAYLDGYAGDVAGEPKIVEAESTDFRRLPEDPGGMAIKNKGSQITRVYTDDGTASGDERVLEPEPPLETTSLAQIESLIDKPDVAASVGDDAADGASALVSQGEAAIDDALALASDTADDAGDLATDVASATVTTAARTVDVVGDAALEAAEPVTDGAVEVTDIIPSRIGEVAPNASDEPDPVIAAADALVASVDAELSEETSATGTEPVVSIENVDPEPANEVTEPVQSAAISAEPTSQPSTAEQVSEAAITEDAPAITSSLAGNFRVQLAAFGTAAAATSAWNDYRRRYQGELEGLSPNIETVSTGDGTLYRLQAGPYDGPAAARASCARIKLLGGDCFIVGPRS